MKYIILFLILGIVVNSAFAQKTYIDPNERTKRGLLDEAEKPVVPAAETPSKPEIPAVPASTELTPLQSLCECGKLKSMNDQLDHLYWQGDELVRAMVKVSEIEARRTNVQEAMVFIVATHKDDKSPVDPDQCPVTKIGENNMKQLKQLIAAQEKKCDVYKLRGINND